jgi:cobalt-zinc-cadmium efflux system outer membrane protein
MERFIEIANAKHATGTATLTDVLRAKVERDGLRADRATLARSVTAARGGLNVLLDRRPDAALGTLAPLAEPVPSIELARLYDLALDQRPELLAAEERVASADAVHSRARQEWLPDFAFGAGYMQNFATNNNFPEAVAGITLPIFPTSINAHIREADAVARQSRAEARATRNRVLDEITQQSTRVDAAAERFAIFAKDAVPRAEEAIKSAEASYVAKEIDFLALVDTQRQLLAKQVERERALADYTIARAELERAVGTRSR